MDLEACKRACVAFGFYTRLVAVALPLEFAPLKPEHESEYLQLGQSEGGFSAPWEVFYGKDREDIIFKALSEIYQKLERIERYLHEQDRVYLPLEGVGVIGVLGHGILGVKSGGLKEGELYYMRTKLPKTPYKRLGFVARAFTPMLLSVERMHASDIKEWDSHIAQSELESLNERKAMHGLEL
ncbi:hypothetical protein [Helicobacter sp. NHP22-001]|uniref:hypothetical protein n=1 Tax=Helicobacter sp. NHP22-001 TaxID=3040202 RepID=UPI00244D9712|nr:hypothetical protein [Helicobacter sp. NHP22-001]GMB95758.1 hypothetical protein NHP22001_03470 [Helicobacter sp. NHP22-001]